MFFNYFRTNLKQLIGRKISTGRNIKWISTSDQKTRFSWATSALATSYLPSTGPVSPVISTSLAATSEGRASCHWSPQFPSPLCAQAVGLPWSVSVFVPFVTKVLPSITHNRDVTPTQPCLWWGTCSGVRARPFISVIPSLSELSIAIH